jgi:hypothetical protein
MLCRSLSVSEERLLNAYHIDFNPYREQEHHPCDIQLLLFLQGSRTYVSGRTRARRKSRTADARTGIAQTE